MNIFEFAMKMEQDGRNYYLESAEKIEAPELKKILVQLADDEQKHYDIFKAMAEGKKATYDPARATSILSTVKNVFEDLKAQGKDFSFAAEAQAMWKAAQKVEEDSERFYREKAGEVDSDDQKNILNRIADEERRHWITIENIIHFLDRPNHWLEDAEWSNLDSY